MTALSSIKDFARNFAIPFQLYDSSSGFGQSSSMELAAAPNAETGAGSDRARKQQLLVILIVATAAMVFNTKFVIPVFDSQSFLFSVVATAPISLLCDYVIFKRFHSPGLNSTATSIYLLGALIMAPICSGAALLTLNELLDHMPATQRAYVVQGKELTRSGKGGAIVGYHVRIDIDDFGAPPSFLGKSTPVRRPNEVNLKVSQALFRTITPGKSKIAVTLHPGYLGIPWVSSHFKVLP